MNGNVAKRKRGAQPGNRNSIGNNGGAPFGNKNAFKHGAYERLALETMTADEREVFEDSAAGSDVERELRQTLAALNAKEVRLLKLMRELTARGANTLDSVEQTRRELHRRIPGVESGAESTHGAGEFEEITSTATSPTFDALSRLEAELDKVQGRKIKLLGQLDKMRIDRERKRVEGENKKSRLAEAWIEALVGEHSGDED